MFNFFVSTAQFKKGKLYLKNGETKTGLIKTRDFGGLKFKKHKGAETELYDYNNTIGYDITEKGIIKFLYKKIGLSNPRLMRIVRLGKINLYSQIQGKREIITGLKYSNKFIYFIEKNDLTYKVGSKFKKKDLELINDCPILIQKIKKKEFKKKEIYKIVNFYNNNCD